MSWGRETATQPRMAEDARGNRRFRVHGRSCAWCGRAATTRGLFIYRLVGMLNYRIPLQPTEPRFCNLSCYDSYQR